MDMVNMTMNNMSMQMNFYWGRDVTILFSKWPGNDQHNPGMYILALFFVFSMAFVMEALFVWPRFKPGKSSVATGLTQAALYAIRVSLGYFMMLAVMSYNIGVFIAAVAGHTVGFFVAMTSAVAMNKPSELESSTSI